MVRVSGGDIETDSLTLLLRRSSLLRAHHACSNVTRDKLLACNRPLGPASRRHPAFRYCFKTLELAHDKIQRWSWGMISKFAAAVGSLRGVAPISIPNCPTQNSRCHGGSECTLKSNPDSPAFWRAWYHPRAVSLYLRSCHWFDIDHALDPLPPAWTTEVTAWTSHRTR